MVSPQRGPVRRVLICEPDQALRDELVRVVRAIGYTADAVADIARGVSRIDAGGIDAAVIDLSDVAGLDALDRVARAGFGVPILATGSNSSIELAVEAMKRGARDFLRKPFSVTALESAIRSILGCRSGDGGDADFVSEDSAVRRLLVRAESAAASDATIQIVGESGTGKELLARFIHWKSPRRSAPFVVVNCAVLSDNLGEAELFGHERGAFTGAVEARIGQVEASDGGTLMLDEVSEASIALQPKLLRVLQEREVQPLGSVAPRGVDVRILCTTQRDLRDEVAMGRFREDLYYRLDVIVLKIPPLRERAADIPLLARTFLRRFAAENGSEPALLGDRVMARLLEHPFRGNVRELENLMRRAAVLNPGEEVNLDTIAAPGESEGTALGLLGGSLNLRELEKRAIVHCLADSGGNRTAASRALGISVRTLRNKIRLYELR